jgi:hypothetical protein
VLPTGTSYVLCDWGILNTTLRGVQAVFYPVEAQKPSVNSGEVSESQRRAAGRRCCRVSMGVHKGPLSMKRARIRMAGAVEGETPYIQIPRRVPPAEPNKEPP